MANNNPNNILAQANNNMLNNVAQLVQQQQQQHQNGGPPVNPVLLMQLQQLQQQQANNWMPQQPAPQTFERFAPARRRQRPSPSFSGEGLSTKSKKTLNQLLKRPAKKRGGSVKGNGVAMGTTSTTDLMRLGKNLPRLKILPVDKLPKRLTAGSYIINADVGSGPGTHWLGLYSGPKQEYTVIFDSFGMTPDPRIIKFAKTGKKRVIGLNTQIQDVDSSNCGQYVIDFLKAMHKGTSPAKYLSQWDGDDQSKNEKRLTKKFTGKSMDGDGFLTDLALKGARKVFGADDGIKFPGENHLPWGPYNWAGPGTNVSKRLELLKQGKSKPIDDIDKAAYHHDLAYGYARKLLSDGKISKAQHKQMIAKADAEFSKKVRASRNNSWLSKSLVAGTFDAKSLVDKVRESPAFSMGSRTKDPTDKQWKELGFPI